MKTEKYQSWRHVYLARQQKLLARAGNYMAAHILEAEIVAGVAIVLWILGKLPYFNIYLTPYLTFFIIFICVTLLFRIAKTVLLSAALMLFSVCFLLLLRAETAAAEEVGNLIYFLLWYVAVLYVKELWNDLQKQ